jgi:deoxyadenosine/deoxycytidine kinase
MLAELLRFGPQTLTGPAADDWWQETCKKWAHSLDVVVCLDTEDAILVERIRSREKKHGVKENSDQWAREFLARYRAAQEKVLAALNIGTKSPKISHFDTSKLSLAETIGNILALF